MQCCGNGWCPFPNKILEQDLIGHGEPDKLLSRERKLILPWTKLSMFFSGRQRQKGYACLSVKAQIDESLVGADICTQWLIGRTYHVVKDTEENKAPARQGRRWRARKHIMLTDSNATFAISSGTSQCSPASTKSILLQTITTGQLSGAISCHSSRAEKRTESWALL